MKKFILSILFVFLFLVTSSNAYAQSSDCWKEFSDAKAICDQAVTKQSLLDKCDQANNIVHQCLGLDKNPWKLESSKLGYLTCQEWKKLMIAGTAQNCIAPLSEIFEKKLWCLSSVAEMKQVRSHPVDYILDFDPNSCIATEDDLRQFKEELPLTPRSSSEVSQNTAKNSTEQKNQPKGDKENLFVKALGGSPVFIGEWFKAITTGWGMGEFFYESMALGDEVLRGKERREIAEEKAEEQKKSKIEAQQALEDYFDKQGLADLDQVLNRDPVIKDSPDYKTGQWQQNSPFRLDILDGQAQIKYPGETEWKDIKVGDKIPTGSTIFTGMDTTTVLSIRDKGVVQILPFTEITITEEGLTDPSKTTTEIDLRTGEIELNVEGGAYGASFQVFTTNAVAGVRGTHFWVSYNKNKRLSTVGVYKGQVEVKASGSDKSMLVSPTIDKPGVVLVAQKLSVVKLILTGFVLIAAIIGIIFFFKKRGNKTFRPKKIRLKK